MGELKEIKTRQEGDPVCAIICPLMHRDVKVGWKCRNSVCPLLYHWVASKYRKYCSSLKPFSYVLQRSVTEENQKHLTICTFLSYPAKLLHLVGYFSRNYIKMEITATREITPVEMTHCQY